MHCSPVGAGGPGHPIHVGGLPYQQQIHRSPHNSPPRPQYIPAFLTGVDTVAAVAPRPRRMFERSPSTSPVAAGSRSPQSKSPGWDITGRKEATHQSSSGFGNPAEVAHQGGGIYGKRGQVQGRQLQFTEGQSVLNATNGEKEKKKNGPPICGFGK